MALVSQQYMAVPEDPELAAETGWPDVRKAIIRILIGYLLCIVCCVELAALVAYLVLCHPAKPTMKEVTAGEAIAMTGLLLFVLGQGWSIKMVAGGSWTCLLRSPERCHAKWLMFATILFVLIAPSCGFFSGLMLINAPRPRHEAAQVEDDNTVVSRVRNLDRYLDREHVATASGVLQIISHILSWMSTVLFILYLRQVGRCWENQVCVCLADLYLFYMGALITAAIGLMAFAPDMLAQMTITLGLGVGLALALVWFLFLLFMTASCISAGLASRQSALLGEGHPAAELRPS
jgi:hypothetical protein